MAISYKVVHPNCLIGFPLVPKLRLGNPFREAPASRAGTVGRTRICTTDLRALARTYREVTEQLLDKSGQRQEWVSVMGVHFTKIAP